MPKIAKPLTALAVKNLKHPGGKNPANIAVGGTPGLQIQITPTGAKSWILRYTAPNGRRRQLGLGGYPAIGLASAQEAARQARAGLVEGVDPVAQREASKVAAKAEAQREVSKAFTFRMAAAKVVAKKETELSNRKAAAQWQSTLAAFAFPQIGDLPVSQIERADILRVLTPIWESKTETASRLRGRIETVLDWATVNGYRAGDNPARWRGNLDHDLPKPGKLKKGQSQNWPAVHYTEAAGFYQALSQREGMAARALQFDMLCASRSGEVRGATWAEIDLEAGVWTIPESRMKAGKEHRVPLSQVAVDLLQALPRAQGSDVIFWAPRGGSLSDMSLSAVMRRMHEAETKAGRTGWLDQQTGRPAVPHGLRSTFRDWVAERTTFQSELAEAALAHTLGNKVQAAYQRGDWLEKRRALMSAWADFVTGEQADVIQIRRGVS